ncbi:MAG TPA: hypothetical protein VF401_01650 [Candidatus Saccharimonadales bacterium]
MIQYHEMRDIHEFHDPQFDQDVQIARNFALSFGSPTPLMPIERITVVPEERADEFRDFYNKDFLSPFSKAFQVRNVIDEDIFVGKYISPHHSKGVNSHSVVVMDWEDDFMPNTRVIRRLSWLVHELTHSITFVPGIQPFYREIQAGIGELLFLRDLDRVDAREQPQDIEISASYGSESTSLVTIPGEARVMAGEEEDGELRWSDSALAAYAILKALEATNIKLSPTKLIRLSSPKYGTRGVGIIRQCLERLQPELPELIETCFTGLKSHIGAELEIAHFILETVAEQAA